jgi:hypothetical protein
MSEEEIRTLADWAPKPEYVPGKEPKRTPKPKPKKKPRKHRAKNPNYRAEVAFRTREEEMKNNADFRLPDLDDPWGSQAEAYFEAAKKAESKHFRAFKPTEVQRKLVMTASGLGLPHRQIALLILDHRSALPIGENTLRKVFKDELEIGVAKSNYYAMGNLFRHTFTAPGAAIFWAKARLKWSDRESEMEIPLPSRDNLSALEVARRVAFVLNAAVMNVNLSPYGASGVRNEGKELRVIEQSPD